MGNYNSGGHNKTHGRVEEYRRLQKEYEGVYNNSLLSGWEDGKDAQ